MSPAVTIILSTYNWSSVLPYSIASAREQTFGDFELLVIGDACTDDSEQVVQAIGDSDPRMRWINLPTNSGHQSGPNNEGLRQARGEWIAYLGHDDLWLPHHLSCLLSAAKSAADLAYGMAAIIAPEGSEIEPAVVGDYRPDMWIPPTSLIHRRSVTEDIGGWKDYRDLRIDPESDLWRRVADGGYRLRFVPRLTAIKLPAARRRDVYKTRPCHEQSAWLDRIRQESDLETVLLARMAATGWNLARKPAAATPYSLLLSTFLQETGRRFLHRVSGGRSRSPVLPKPGAIVAARRRFKGL